MSLMKEYPRNMNIYIKNETYEALTKVAQKEGRKPGNLVRRILEKWAEVQNKGTINV